MSSGNFIFSAIPETRRHRNFIPGEMPTLLLDPLSTDYTIPLTCLMLVPTLTSCSILLPLHILAYPCLLPRLTWLTLSPFST